MNKKTRFNFDDPELVKHGLNGHGLSIIETPECVLNALLSATTGEQKILIIKETMVDLIDNKDWIDNAVEAIRSKIDEQ